LQLLPIDQLEAVPDSHTLLPLLIDVSVNYTITFAGGVGRAGMRGAIWGRKGRVRDQEREAPPS